MKLLIIVFLILGSFSVFAKSQASLTWVITCYDVNDHNLSAYVFKDDVDQNFYAGFRQYYVATKQILNYVQPTKVEKTPLPTGGIQYATIKDSEYNSIAIFLSPDGQSAKVKFRRQIQKDPFDMTCTERPW